jgi:hypothetical protein
MLALLEELGLESLDLVAANLVESIRAKRSEQVGIQQVALCRLLARLVVRAA